MEVFAVAGARWTSAIALEGGGGGALTALGGATLGARAATTGGTLAARAAGAAVGRAAATAAGGGAGVTRGAGGGGADVRGAGGGPVLMGETAIPTMSASSRSRVARRSRIAGGATVLASTGPETGAGGGVEVARATGGAEGRGRGIDGRTLSLMPGTRASCVPPPAPTRREEIRRDLAAPARGRSRTAAMFMDRDA